MEPKPTPTAASSPNHPTVTPVDPAELLTEAQVSKMLGISPKTLATWRSTGRYALPFLRIGARIRYRRQDVATWLESRQRTSTTPAQGVA